MEIKQQQSSCRGDYKVGYYGERSRLHSRTAHMIFHLNIDLDT
jgi:hypothetical protein